MKETRKAKVIYNQNEDRFEVHINTGDGWGLETAYQCLDSSKGKGTTEFIHWSVLAKLAQLQHLGYDIYLGGVL